MEFEFLIVSEDPIRDVPTSLLLLEFAQNAHLYMKPVMTPPDEDGVIRFDPEVLRFRAVCAEIDRRFHV